MDVQTIGPRREIIARAHELAAETGGFIYGEHENGGTNTIYVSPVPFEVLNEAIQQGPGKPHLGKVANSMEKEENLTWAVLAAPVVGVAAGLLKAGNALAGSGERTDGRRGDE
jgi:hypothetical protein